MRTFSVQTFDEWRAIARQLLIAAVPPESVRFHDRPEQRSLFADTPIEGALEPQSAAGTGQVGPRVPGRFLEVARSVACHRDEDRFQLLYQILWRLTTTEPQLLEIITDDDIHRMNLMQKAVHRDSHKMKAFVRFRKVVDGAEEYFIAWHRPDHRIVRLVAPFFARRFPEMNWAILTPDESVAWDRKRLVYGPGHSQSDAPDGDELEDLWRTYYGAIFNPARIKLNAMIREMPARHWATLPETRLIPELLADAPRRVSEMIARQEGFSRSAQDHLPEIRTWENLRSAATGCRGCELFKDATQTVFGEGPRNARVMFVGEQPGDNEDLAGHPFVGPAGEVLTAAIEQAGLDRQQIYVTNAVKHFKFEPSGGRRLHKKPSSREMSACHPWVEAEIDLIKPEILVCLGATAAQSLIGPEFSITRQRGEFMQIPQCGATIATYHPSAILRSPTPEQRESLRMCLVKDLVKVRKRLDG
jgi:probable DNA metabolism protein